MSQLHVFWVGALSILLNGCGGSETTQTTPQVSDSNQITVDAGLDKRTVVNQSIELEGSVSNSQSTAVSYEWKEGEQTLATTRIFSYLPTESGVHLLSFTAQNSDGSRNTDNMIVIVTTQVIDTNIPKMSNALISSYLNEINKARSQEQDCGTKGIFSATTSVSWNEKLYKASYEHIQDLIASETFSHDGSGTESDWTGYLLGKQSNQVERVESYGYSWQRLGENLAGGTKMDSAKAAIQAWLESDNHCENLMNPLFKEVGMVMLEDENALYTHYWGQNFGTPK
ncbi:MAG TPA: hypothetical protein ENK95_01915 [Campylobacterales bacterium]|nr:hypothetical protein [Campylobacterales bacterium]